MSPELIRIHAERAAKIAALGKAPPWWRPFKRRRWLIAMAATTSMFEAILAITAAAEQVAEAFSARALAEWQDSTTGKGAVN